MGYYIADWVIVLLWTGPMSERLVTSRSLDGVKSAHTLFGSLKAGYNTEWRWGSGRVVGRSVEEGDSVPKNNEQIAWWQNKSRPNCSKPWK